MAERRSRKPTTVESDDEQMDFDEDSYDEDQEDEEDIDEELNLPDILLSIGVKEKRELLSYKRNHNETEWELELARRQELLERKLDMERLKRMQRPATEEQKQPKTSKRGRSAKAPVAAKPKATQRRSSREVDEDDDDEEFEDELSEEEIVNTKAKSTRAAQAARAAKSAPKKPPATEDDDEDDAAEEDDEDDDLSLFDSDEEEEQNAKFGPSGGKAETSKALGAKRRAIETGAVAKSAAPTSAKKARRGEGLDSDEDYSDEGAGGKQSAKESRRSTSTRLGEDDDEEEDEEGEYDEDSDAGRRQYEDDEEEEDTTAEAVLEDYLKIQIRRYMVENMLLEPYFKKAIVGQFVRISIGELDGIAVYRMAEVTNAELSSKQYKLHGTDKVTRWRMELDIAGSVRKNMRLDKISNSRITEHELQLYLDAARSTRTFKALTQKKVNRRREEYVKTVKGHKYTHDEINQMVQQKHGLNAQAITTEKTAHFERLKKRLEIARGNEDYDQMDALSKAIEKLEREKMHSKEQYDKIYKKQADLNKRNMMANFEKDQRAGANASKSRSSEEGQVQDPFTRRPTKLEAIWHTGASLELEKTKLKLEADRKEIKDLREKAVKLRSDGRDVDADINESQAADKEVALQAAEAKYEEKKAVSQGTKGTQGASASASASASKGKDTKDVKETAGGSSRSLKSAHQTEKEKEMDALWKLKIEEIGARVGARLGVNPWEASQQDRRSRYLKQACKGLPSKGSEQRESLRQGLSLAEYVLRLAEQAE